MSQMEQLYGLLPLIILFVLMYFLMIRPQQQQAKKRQAMLNSLKVGDEVVTIGGIHGSIRAIDDTTIILQVAPNVQIKFNRHAVGSVRESSQ